MIRIYVNEEKKRRIENIFWQDAQKAKTGLVNVLKDKAVIRILKRNHSKIYNRLYDPKSGVLDENEVKKLLFADREELKEYIDEFGSYEGSKALFEELVNQVFRYKNFSERQSAVKILRELDIYTCPYCNRQYIFTLKNGKVRPQFDHYYPQSLYPYLALSLYNLIPSCSICNQAKSSLDTVTSPILYPYEEEFGYDVKFQVEIGKNESYTRIMQGISDDFEIKVYPEGLDVVDNQMEKLHLNELYHEHKGYVQDILKSYYINPPERIQELYDKFGDLFSSKEEIRGLLYMSALDKASWGSRPLSKLTYDIDKQLERNKF
ncbi:HNH nuclease [Clostridium sp. MCC353]|uniref:HNH endonuclease n=1 Tax=Clostridium sp. MCC353 TaxID=2592646 RepID=UPI001C01EE8A|nr:hypothetical protein [Clostridium sp. MCC353]MBT9777203.1 HNH nuclease [Clostridium sp. MCC353]